MGRNKCDSAHVLFFLKTPQKRSDWSQILERSTTQNRPSKKRRRKCSRKKYAAAVAGYSKMAAGSRSTGYRAAISRKKPLALSLRMTRDVIQRVIFVSR